MGDFSGGRGAREIIDNDLLTLGSRNLQTPSPRYGPYSQGTQSPSGRGGAHNCGYGFGAVPEQGHRRYSGAQRDPSRPATPGPSYANVFEVSVMGDCGVMGLSVMSGPGCHWHIDRDERGIVHCNIA